MNKTNHPERVCQAISYIRLFANRTHSLTNEQICVRAELCVLKLMLYCMLAGSRVRPCITRNEDEMATREKRAATITTNTQVCYTKSCRAKCSVYFVLCSCTTHRKMDNRILLFTSDIFK